MMAKQSRFEEYADGRLVQRLRERFKMGRGLFRIWLVLTIIWAAFVIFASGYSAQPEAATIALEAIFVPSGVILVIGLMLRWALRGFSRHS
jgi:hypothetical protein